MCPNRLKYLNLLRDMASFFCSATEQQGTLIRHRVIYYPHMPMGIYRLLFVSLFVRNIETVTAKSTACLLYTSDAADE